MIFLFANNAYGALLTDISADADVLSLEPGQGSRFPVPSSAQGTAFAISVFDEADLDTFEIMFCIARSGDLFTLLRGQEGTLARAWPIGTRVELRITAAALTAFAQGSGIAAITAAQIPATLATVPTVDNIQAALNDLDVRTGIVGGLIVDGGTPAASSQAVKYRGGTYAEWQSANPTLQLREVGIELDRGQWKVGDGVTAWNALPYFGGEVVLKSPSASAVNRIQPQTAGQRAIELKQAADGEDFNDLFSLLDLSDNRLMRISPRQIQFYHPTLGYIGFVGRSGTNAATLYLAATNDGATPFGRMRLLASTMLIQPQQLILDHPSAKLGTLLGIVQESSEGGVVGFLQAQSAYIVSDTYNVDQALTTSYADTNLLAAPAQELDAGSISGLFFMETTESVTITCQAMVEGVAYGEELVFNILPGQTRISPTWPIITTINAADEITIELKASSTAGTPTIRNSLSVAQLQVIDPGSSINLPGGGAGTLTNVALNASRSALASDVRRMLVCDVGADITLTLPAGLNASLTDSDYFMVYQKGAGKCKFAVAAGGGGTGDEPTYSVPTPHDYFNGYNDVPSSLARSFDVTIPGGLVNSYLLFFLHVVKDSAATMGIVSALLDATGLVFIGGPPPHATQNETEVYVFGLASPTSGTRTCAIQLSSTTNRLISASIVPVLLEGVDQTTPYSGFVLAEATINVTNFLEPTLPGTVAENALIIGSGLMTDGANTITEVAGQTTISEGNGGKTIVNSSHRRNTQIKSNATAGSGRKIRCEWSAQRRMSMAALAINPAAGGGGPQPVLRLESGKAAETPGQYSATTVFIHPGDVYSLSGN